jgi:gluconate kinase
VNYEAWRPALIAFYESDSPWMRQKLENLRRGDPLTDEDKRTIDGLALKVAA